jgi:hypothetical protein
MVMEPPPASRVPALDLPFVLRHKAQVLKKSNDENPPNLPADDATPAAGRILLRLHLENAGTDIFPGVPQLTLNFTFAGGSGLPQPSGVCIGNNKCVTNS